MKKLSYMEVLLRRFVSNDEPTLTRMQGKHTYLYWNLVRYRFIVAADRYKRICE